MLICIRDILDGATLDALTESLTDDDLFAPGESTAAGRARQVKRNLQAPANLPAVRGATGLIRSLLDGHQVFQAAARPRQIARLMINRYDSGMGYGQHVDAPLMDGIRTDLSFTLFLSPPESYEGGALVIDSGAGEERIKLPAGSLVLYPSRFLHAVETVTAGSRLAAVGWLESRVRSEEQRDLLFDLDTALADLKAGHAGPEDTQNRLTAVRNNLLRLWLD